VSLARDVDFYTLLTGSYQRLVGKPLGPPVMETREGAAWLQDTAPFCVLAHDNAVDPRFVYANRAAQRCFEYSWDEITSLPSRLSADTPDREERRKLLEAVTRDGFATGYRGLRIARSGRRFWIEDGTVWQLIDETGVVRGQAATFPTWYDV
jgi:PAS domain-containing protein